MGDVSDEYRRALARSSLGARDVREAVDALTDEQRDRLVENLRRAKEVRGET